MLTSSPQAASAPSRLLPIDGLDLGTEGHGQILRPRAAPIGERDLGHTSLDQAVQHGARGATCAEHHHWAPSLVPAGRLLIKIGHEAVNVGVGRLQPSRAVEPERVGGADGACGSIGDVGSFERDQLMRQRDIGADIAVLRKRTDEVLGLLGRHGLLLVGAVDAVQLQPVAMDRR